MDATVMYHSLHCRGLSVNHSTGELRYVTDDPDVDMPFFTRIAQFIGVKPISENCESFSIEIVNSGMRCIMGVGLCHKRYHPDRMPGWDHNSIGYHADNGGIYHEFGMAREDMTFEPVGQGEVMECLFDFDHKTVTFSRNGIEVFTSRPVHIPPGGFYPIICLGSYGEVVRLLETQPWTPDTDAVSLSKDTVVHSLYCRETKISHVSGIVRYNSLSADLPVGQFVSKCPLSPECNRFLVEIASLGQKSSISIGACHHCYPSNCQPGWLPNSIAYHVDDGGFYHGSDKSISKEPMAKTGDTLSCEFDFSTKTFTFRRNDSVIFNGPPVPIPPGGFHAAVGFHSPGEAVCLMEKKPWRSETEKVQRLPPQTVVPEELLTAFESVRLSDTEPWNPAALDPSKTRTMLRCCLCIENGVSRFLIPCGHTFCDECIEEWMIYINKTCPACRVSYQDVKMLYF